MTTAPSLAAQVEATFLRALFTPEEVAAGAADHVAVAVEGIVTRAGFHPRRLEASRAEVLALCDAIVQPSFWADRGGGSSFLALPFDRDGGQWGEHRNAEQLYLLAAGLGLAAFVLPRAHWTLLPGGVPYLVFRRAPLAPADEVRHG